MVISIIVVLCNAWSALYTLVNLVLLLLHKYLCIHAMHESPSTYFIAITLLIVHKQVLFNINTASYEVRGNLFVQLHHILW